MRYPNRSTRLSAVLSAALALFLAAAATAAPLKVFVRGGVKSHGPDGNGVHEHFKFLNEFVELLKSRGAEAEGGINFPNDEQLAKADVLVMYAQDGGNIPPERRAALDNFTKRGGGIVVIHTASVSADSEHWKSVIGGSWVQGKTKWREGPMDLYYVDNQDPVAVTKPHPITKGASNFHMDDEIYYDMDISPDVRVLATSYTPNVREGRRPAEGNKPHIYDIQPQMWTYEKDNYRAFVSIPGHLIGTFHKPNYRAVLLRGISWAGKRENVDELVKPEEIEALTYPEGGPQKPADTLKALEVHPDFDLTLVVAEPLINKPMNFDWDAAGRLWVAETPEYPNGRRGMRPDYRGKEWKDRGGIDQTPGKQDRPARDKISILTDTNSDGVMDKKEVFYEGLDLVTGLVFHKDGVIVTQAPDILWLRDTDKDGKADKVEKLYTNLGTGDTHAVINNPRWGWDGWIYATHGYSASGDVRNAKGEKQDNIGSGVVRFRPDGSKIEQYSSKGGNTWGLQVTADNRIMWTQPTSGELLMHTVLPEYALARGKWGNTPSYNVVEKSGKTFPAMPWEQLAYVQIDWVGSFTAAAGTVVYDGGSWPEEYNGDYFTTEPTINIIHHARLSPKGSSYTFNKLPGREETEFIRSKDMWWRPIEVRVGPDGAVYIGDFYNQAVIHNDTRGPDHNNVNAAVRPDRDHYFGRIWRLNHKQAKKIAVPDLSKADAAALVKALEHSNRHVRMNASRLLVETEAVDLKALNQFVLNTTVSPDYRVAAMWVLAARRSLDSDTLGKLLQGDHRNVRRNAALLFENGNIPLETGNPGALRTSLARLLTDPSEGVRVGALRAFSATVLQGADAAAIIAAWPKFDDDFQKSAAVGALSQNSAAAIAAILDSGDASLAPLASNLAQGIGEKNDSAAAAKLVIALAEKPASADSLKRGILDTLGKSLKAAPEMTPELTAAITKLLASGASASVLPIAAQWDKAGALKGAMESQVKELFGKVKAGSDDERFTAAQTLIGLRSVNGDAIPAVIAAATGDASAGLKVKLINALGETDDKAIGPALAAGFAKLSAEAQSVALGVLLKRPDWSVALLDAIKAKQLDPAVLGPANIYRLRSHPNKGVSEAANGMMDILMPGAKAMAEVIAKLAPEVEKKGDAARGKVMFTATCATCHKFGNEGAEVGPNLTGMGAHGAGELLTAIADPNAEVDPSFTAVNIETKDGQSFAGVIARENPSSIYLKFLGGEKEIRTADIKTRTNTGRSLMPEGFGSLAPEILRDIITYMQETDGGNRFRTVDMRSAFTVNTSMGIYESQDFKDQTLRFRKTGTVKVEEVPFNVVAPEKAPQNVLVLKGGPGHAFCSKLPQKVDIKVGGYKANRIHILGGVSGWGYQPGAEVRDILKITIHTTQGQREGILCRSGVEFSDYIYRIDVPGSKFVPGLVEGNQIRSFGKQLSLGAVEIDRITLESVPSGGAPTIAAITLEMNDGPPLAAPKTEEPKTSKLEWKGTGEKILLVGGGSSHDFNKFFNIEDTKLLTENGYSVAYTEDGPTTITGLADAKVAILSVNSPAWATPDTRKAIMEYALKPDRGLILLHAGLWYNFGDWPEYNQKIAGGGSRGHDRLGEFEVKVTKPDHAIFKGVPQSFSIVDELYYYEPVPVGGTPIEVLATAHSQQRNKDYPMVFTIGLPNKRAIGLTLGHDAKAHVENEAFRKILLNSVAWAAGK